MFIATTSFAVLTAVVKYLSHIPAHELILFRSIISLVLSYAYLSKNKIPVFGNNKPLLVIRGIVGTAALLLFFLSIQKIPLASAATIQYLSPIFTAIISIFYLKERIKPMQWLFFMIAFMGVYFIRGFEKAPDGQGIYILLAVISAFLSGIAYNIVRKLKDSDKPLVIVFYFPFIAFPIMAVWSYFDWVTPQGIDWILILIIGLLTQTGQVYMSKALQLEKASSMTNITFLGAIIALSFSIFLFKETYAITTIVGIGLILLGVTGNIFSKSKEEDVSIK